MPTRAESSEMNGVMDTFQSCESWTDALPVCNQTGVGVAFNQEYRVNRVRQELHPFEDKSFHFRVNNDTSFYGLFDGHNGTKAANFVTTQLPADVLLEQMSDKKTDDQIYGLLKHAFSAVEKEYFQLIADLLAEKTALDLQIQGISRYEAYHKFPEIVNRLEYVNSEVSSGTTAVVALIHCNRLHVANIGDSRAILCKSDPYGNYTSMQLSTDHDLYNNEELIRLSKLGLDMERLRQCYRIGSQAITRCIGNYLVKGAYKEYDYLCTAVDEPVIAEPDIRGSISIDESCQFLILCSAGLYRALEEATGTRQVNLDLVKMVTEEFKVQNNLTGVAQAVVNKVCRIHQDQYFASVNSSRPMCQKIDDMTLMVRNFNYQLRGISSPSSRSPLVNRFGELHISVTEEDDDNPHVYHRNDSSTTLQPISSAVSTVTDRSTNSTIQDSETTNTTTNSTDFEDRRFFDSRRVDPLELDSEGKLQAYVDFDAFCKAIQEAQNNGISVDFECGRNEDNNK